MASANEYSFLAGQIYDLAENYKKTTALFCPIAWYREAGAAQKTQAWR